MDERWGAGEHPPPVIALPVGAHGSRHGRPASWALVAVVIAAFCAGGAAVIGHLWWLFWACAAVAVLAVPAGKVIGIMGDTVEVYGGADPSPAGVREGAAADPGVRPRRPLA